MPIYNLCRTCERRISKTVAHCGQCGSSNNINRSKKILCGIFAASGMLLMLLIARVL